MKRNLGYFFTVLGGLFISSLAFASDHGSLDMGGLVAIGSGGATGKAEKGQRISHV